MKPSLDWMTGETGFSYLACLEVEFTADSVMRLSFVVVVFASNW